MKLMKRKRSQMVCIGLVGIALLTGAIVYLTVTLPRQQRQEEHLRQVQEYRDTKMERYRQENAQWEDYEVDVAFLGDSLTDLYDLEQYYPQYKTANRGIGGDTTSTLKERLEVSVYELKPKVVVLLIGANNVDTMLDDYEQILQGLQTGLPGTKVVLLSLTAMGGEIWGINNQRAAYNNVTIRLLAEKYGYPFIDLYSPMFDISTGEVYDGYTIDGAHLTPLGYTVITGKITPVLETLLG